MAYVQLKNPVTKNWVRVNTRTGKIVGRRKQPYSCKRYKADSSSDDVSLSVEHSTQAEF